MRFLERLRTDCEKQLIPDKICQIFRGLYETYSKSLGISGLGMEPYEKNFITFLERVEEQIRHPYHFQPYHRKVVEPFNYYNFGVEFIRPLVDTHKSKVFNSAVIEKMIAQLLAKENVILLANHQTEVDPQLMSILLEGDYHEFVSEIIFVAGDRVITDPMAVPLSMGKNLLCIYSKKHIDDPPEKKLEKQQHNQRTMKLLSQLLAEGGKCIYVAPSGGRDRANAEGHVEVAPFDPQSVEMFRLMAKQSGKAAHFYPLALSTYGVLPPPSAVQIEVGEMREAKREGVGFSFGEEIDMEHFPGKELKDKQARRIALAMHVWKLVKTDYSLLKGQL